MDKLHEMEVFVNVAESGSFTKAAKRLRLSPPAVTRAVSSLEDRLGAQVFSRTTRSLTITDVGQRFLESARRILIDLEMAEREAIGESATPRGHLSITASVAFGRTILGPVVSDFLHQHPRITASLHLFDRFVNLVEEGLDVAIRIGDLPDSNLIARRVGEVHRMLVASPEYLARRGRPETPADLQLNSVIAVTGLVPNREWHFAHESKTGTISLRPLLEVNDAPTAIKAAEQGHGIATTLSYMVSEQVEEGTLVPLLNAFMLPPQPVHVVYPHARLVAPKIRAFMDFAAPRLKSRLDDLSSVHTKTVPKAPVD